MAARRGRTLTETGGLFTPVNVSASAPVGQPAVVRLFGIPTARLWAFRGNWNITLKPVWGLVPVPTFRRSIDLQHGVKRS